MLKIKHGYMYEGKIYQNQSGGYRRIVNRQVYNVLMLTYNRDYSMLALHTRKRSINIYVHKDNKEDKDKLMALYKTLKNKVTDNEENELQIRLKELDGNKNKLVFRFHKGDGRFISTIQADFITTDVFVEGARYKVKRVF